MTELHPCPSCTELVADGTCVCPHCGEGACHRSGVHGAAVLLGLSLVACGGSPGQPDYTAASVVGETADTAETTTQGHGADFAEAIVDRRIDLYDALEDARHRAREEAE